MLVYANVSHRPIPLYVVHVDDVGKPAKDVRCVATLVTMPGDLTTQEEFIAYLELSGCSFKAALVQADGSLVMSDTRKFT